MNAANASIRIGNYKLGKTLGIGSFGKVKLAEHEITGHKVAVKIMNRKKIKSLDMDEKVRREIKILKLFMHPHIIRLYEVIDTPSHIFVVMEYVAGGELFDYIVQKGRLSEDEARRFFQQIISGVEYCHRHNVVHRDLKPENLLLDSQGRGADMQLNIKIADFGLSNMMRDGFFLKTSCGSPNYAAPEVISGKLYAGPEVDVWSCGVILYALLCGSLPFDDENIPNLFKKIKGGIYTLPSHLSDLARDLIPKMLIVDAVKRITIPEIRQHPWFQIRLPAYLQITPEQRMAQTQIIDDQVLDDVVKKLNFTSEQVAEAVRNGERNQATVAYYLILDQKRRLRQDAGERTIDDAMDVQESAPSPFGDVLSDMVNGVVPNHGSHRRTGSRADSTGGDGSIGASDDPLGLLEPTVPGRDPMEIDSTNPLHSRGLSPLHKEPALPPRKWYLGVQTRQPPAVVMADLYRALKALNFEWKMITAYQVKCRHVNWEGKTVSATATAGVKLNIQLYKVHDTRYLLDIQKLRGGTFVFLDVCSMLMSELRI